MNRPKIKKKSTPQPRGSAKKIAPRGNAPAQALQGGDFWLYGHHPVESALANPKRIVKHILLTKNAGARIDPQLLRGRCEPEIVERDFIAARLPPDAVHQGMAALVRPLPATSLDVIARRAGAQTRLLILDQVSDPHNVGAILRSAAVFGAAAVILPERNAPPETGTLAKSASGALEEVPLIRVGNLARALEMLKAKGFWIVGFASTAEACLGRTKPEGKLALIMGSEGEGMRRLTRENCDLLLHIPMAENKVGSLNVSNAAAIALFACFPEI